MIDLGPHAVFIVWSYLGVAIAVAVTIALTLIASRRTGARLAALEARGIRRRSQTL